MVFEETNHPDEALELIETLEESGHDKDGRIRTCMRWIKGNALAERGELEMAAAVFADIRSDVEQYCSTLDPLLHFFDYAGILLRLGDERRLAAATRIAFERLPRLRLDAELAELAHRALLRIEERSIRLPELRRLRKKLATT